MQQSSSTVSSERVRALYLESLRWKYNQSERIPNFFTSRQTRYYSTKEKLIVFSHKEQIARAQQWAKAYFFAVKPAENHISRLDRTIASLIQCNYDSSHGTLNKETIVSQACDLLSRIPLNPHLPEALYAQMKACSIHSEYFGICEADQRILDHTSWDSLLVTKWIDSGTIRLALAIVDLRESGQFIARTFAKYIDTVAEILEASLALRQQCSSTCDRKDWLIAQSFLWTSWYRSVMLYLYYLQDHQLRWGFDWSRNSHLDLRMPIPDTREADISLTEPKYMCHWAFKLLESDRACILKDFRAFRRRFMELYEANPGRCIVASSQTCSGQGPTHCQRFTGMKIVDQSAHDFNCVGDCESLIWDEANYRRLEGARAVCIAATGSQVIRYCQATQNTIAVSHVWAHGAGGRPETGFNACLHQRLARLAQENCCDSYWMDTPCIPTNHDLRREAISHINKIFTDSKMTLIWDRDIMSVDVSDPTLATQESILCALLVSDWNVRAWTLLESIRARHNVHLLCRNNKLLGLRECILNVHNHGSIEISNLFLTNQHLVPAQAVNRVYDPNPSDGMLKRENGYVSLEESICLLAYRHASRPGDSTTIMSLLMEREPAYTAEEFWKSKVDMILQTGMLFCSQPRLECNGFGWAPAQPEVVMTAWMDPVRQPQQHIFTDGSNTRVARITANGLHATFSTFEIPHCSVRTRLKPLATKIPVTKTGSSAKTQSQVPPLPYQIRKHFRLDKYRQARLVLPLHDSITDPPYLAYRGISNGPIFGVVGSKDRKLRTWHWLGVFEWDPDLTWPELRREEEDIFLV